MRGIGLIVILAACSGSDGQSCPSRDECDQNANEIRAAAQQRGLPAQGICNSTSPSVQRDFKAACDKQRTCNACY